ncbi:sodium-coupled monocarboxylate transporter 1-like [Neocloeon triangulifer]|uniref:sodium-coupled monocarboxylate transporter 1-like n=1 Tax=Neocloeon triangulifer TaxID=2078957 RepID=UPI00286EF28E|nr:sodium-coupled monocarboxylate transporter 1-like [Neocloeon triangulifer]
MQTTDERLFDWSDYLVFAGMLAVSAAIGLYHGCRRRGQSSAEFLTGNGQLGTIPVALSMLASFLSSITLMGQPAEVYLFGPQLWIFGLASFAAIPLTGYVLIPLYREMRLTSAFEYIGRRFDRWLQLFTSTLFSLQMVIYLALVLYAPAMALHQVTGINTEIVVTVMYLVCILYTTIGGMKAVVWTDTFQVLVLYSSMLAILYKGTADLGGFSVVWERNAAANRTQFFNFDMDPTERYTFWGSLVGAAFLHCAVYGVNQLQVQRYLTVPTVEAARRMLWINAFGWTFVVAITVYAGMLIFAQYFDCDPLVTGGVSKPDQLFPLFVMDILGTVPGFPGLFVAGIFSAGLSTVSTGVNSLAAIWLSEINGVFLKSEMSEKRAAVVVKVLALGFGLASFFLVFLVPYMGGLVPVAVSLSSFFSGALLGVFLLGIYCPWANSLGVGTGLVAGVVLVGGMTVGSQIAAESGQVLFTPLPTSIEGCDNSTFTSALLPHASELRQEAHVLLRISFLWYSLIATVCTVVVGLVVSFLTRKTSPSLPSGSRLLHNATIFANNRPKEQEMTQQFKTPSSVIVCWSSNDPTEIPATPSGIVNEAFCSVVEMTENTTGT